MENKIIREAMRKTNGYPWEKLEIDKEQVDVVLKKYDLESSNNREKLYWRIIDSVYKNIKNSNDVNKLIDQIKDDLKEYECLNSLLIRDFLTKRCIRNKNDLELFNEFIKGNIDSEMQQHKRQAYIVWSVDLITSYKVLELDSIDFRQVNNFIIDTINSKFDLNVDDMKISKTSKNLKYSRFCLKHIKSISDINIYKNLLSDIMNFSVADESKDEKYKIDSVKEEVLEEDDDPFSAMLLDIFNSEPVEEPKKVVKEVKKEFKRNEKKDFKEIGKKAMPKEEAKNIVSCEKEKSSSENELKEIEKKAQKMGYKLVKIEDEEDSEFDYVQILMELASLKRGAALSELYNVYKNIEETSEENIRAVMGNFFNKLRVLGFEADNSKTLGEEVIVDTKDVLDKFIFTRPVATKGEMIGKVKYLQWNYKGKKVVPMAVEGYED